MEPENDLMWSPEQVISFCLTPTINAAFVKPLYNIDEHTERVDLPTQASRIDNDQNDSDSQESAMLASSIDSTSDDSISTTESEQNMITD